MTRGERNHNPLNIRRGRSHWLGEAKTQTDRQYVQFRCDLMGYRAAFRTLRTYIQVHHLTCITDIIRRWAPPEDGNDTSGYIALVAMFSGLAPGQHIAYADKAAMMALVTAMARVESGIRAVPQVLLAEAYELAK